MVEPVLKVIVPPEGRKFPPFTFKVPLTEKLAEVVVVPVTVRLLKVRTLLLTIDPPVIVMVPAVGAKVLLAFTVKAPLTEKLEVG